MARIFVSYARGDREFAERLAGFLEIHGHRAWWDRHLDGGGDFAAEIEAELHSSDVVIVVWSQQSIKSRWVRDEAAVGGDSGQLIPLTIDGSVAPMGFRQFHTLDLTGWKGAARDARTGDLLRTIDHRLKKQASPGPPARVEALGQKRFVPAPRPWVARAALLMLLVAIAVGGWLLTRRDSSESAPLRPTIALVPFASDSSDVELRQLAAQTRDSVAHTFSQSGVPVRLLSAPLQSGQTGVDFLISGDFTRSGDKIIASIRLDEAKQGVTVFSHQFEASREETAALPERIGAQMAGNLTWAAPLRMLDRRHPIEPALLADLLKGSDFTGDVLEGYQAVKSVAEKAPNLGEAQLGVAFDTAFVLGQIPRGERPEAIAAAQRAETRAMALMPGFGDAYGIWCILHSETRLAECEDRLREGRRVDPDASFLNTFLSHLLRNVGRFDESMDLARMAHTHDVYVPTKIAWILKSLEYSGASDEARELYDKSLRWWPEYESMYLRNRIFGLLERGDYDGLLRLDVDLGAKRVPPGFEDSTAIVAALKTRSAAAVRRACPASDALLPNARCMLALAIVGDPDGAYVIADKIYPRRVGRTAAETRQIWLDEPDGAGPLEFVTSPAAAPLRRDPRYLALAQRTGLLAYWRTGRLPDFCRKRPEPICARIKPV